MRKEVLLLAFLSVLTLSACVPAAFVVGATTGGAVIADRRPLSTILLDKQIACKALIQLSSEPLLTNRSHLAVATFNQVVLLAGEVETLSLRHRAYELVKAVPSIRRINNMITVGQPLNKKEISLDVWITTKVKAAMIAEKGLNSTQIKVLTEGQVVYLLGLVTHMQAEMATNVVRQVEGVSKVVTLFEYTN